MLSTRLRSLLLGFALCATACPTTPAGMDAAPPNDASDDTAAAEAGLDMGVPDASPPWLAPYTPTMRAPLPANFFWGSSTAAYQIEGGLGNTDWGTWERMGRIANNDRADDGPQSLARYMDDLRTLTETGQNAYRLGIEWARLFPTQAAWESCRAARSMTDLAARHRVCRAAASPAGIAYYDSVLAAARAAGITPLVTLQHFTFPNYMNDLTQDWHTQGWLRPGLPDELALWASFVAREWGDRVDWYVTINEPLVTATVGYLDGRTPPGQRFQLDAILQVVTAQIRSHAAMYDALHAGDTTAAPVMNRSPVSPAPAAMVSIAHHVRRFFPRSAGRNDTNAARNAEYLFNRLFVEAVARGNLDSDGDGTPETRNDPALRNRLDYLGINYYSLTVVDGGAGVPLLGGLPEDDAIQRGLPKNDLGWDIYPRGMEDELLWAATYNLPDRKSVV